MVFVERRSESLGNVFLNTAPALILMSKNENAVVILALMMSPKVPFLLEALFLGFRNRILLSMRKLTSRTGMDGSSVMADKRVQKALLRVWSTKILRP